MTAIGISGSYGGLNVGDEAILTSAMMQQCAAAPDVDRVLSPHDAARAEIAPGIELVLPGGGGILAPRVRHDRRRRAGRASLMRRWRAAATRWTSTTPKAAARC